jgi:hypothetical protein
LKAHESWLFVIVLLDGRKRKLADLTWGVKGNPDAALRILVPGETVSDDLLDIVGSSKLIRDSIVVDAEASVHWMTSNDLSVLEHFTEMVALRSRKPHLTIVHVDHFLELPQPNPSIAVQSTNENLCLLI